MSSSNKPILVVAGIGQGEGTGGAVAREFAKKDYRVAILARGAESIQKLSDELVKSGADAKGFPITTYDHPTLQSVFEDIRAAWPGAPIRVAVWNARGKVAWKPFLDNTPEDVQEGIETNIGAFAFAREAILSFKGQELNSEGKRGTLIFTSATAALRGNKKTSVISSSKFALRSLSQSLAKEFGPQNIHVATAIIDGQILTERSPGRQKEGWAENPDVRLSPESIAKSYVYLAGQDRSALTWELDLRPAHEPW